MEKLLIMCEGPNEKEIIKILLENDLLKFTEDDLLGLTPYHARQIKSSGQVKTELNIYPGQVRILRIGDKQSDKLVIPSEYKDKILSVDKYCTKPELEMLFILAENLEEAVKICAEKAEAGDAVLLSPACASWGQFDNYEQRGDKFKEYVRAML